ncbi:MAG: EAL domain-containing protein [Lachnospira sp.]|nr:EAL domain-containing protein [Lachnospira sp.]
MDKVVYYDVCALLILVILLVSLILRRMTKGRLNKAFLWLNVLILMTTVTDIWAVMLDNMTSGAITLKYIAHTAYLLLHSCMAAMYIVYVVIHTDTMHKFKKNKILIGLTFAPVVIITVLLAVNLGNKFIFYINEEGQYVRGQCFLVLYGAAVIGIILGIIYLVMYRKALSVRNFVALLAVYPFTIVAVLAQYFMPGLLVEMFANACGMLFVSMIVQRPEELIDVNTGLKKLGAYLTDMERIFYNEKQVTIIMVNVVNYVALKDMLGYNGINVVLRKIARQIEITNEKENAKAELYYLGNGRFQFVMERSKAENAMDVAEFMCDYLKTGISYKHMDLNIVNSICIARCPEDLKDYGSLMSFIDDEAMTKYKDCVIEFSAIRKNDFYDIMKNIDEIVERALANHSFAVYYQPIYSVKENRFASAEALLRLNDAEYGFVSPAVFIPAAEKSGAIYKIGEFVFEEVCKFISSEEFEHLGLDYIEVNMSVAQCMQSNLASQILTTIKKYNIDPKKLNLEITETAASYSQKTLMDNLITLHDAGIAFSLDDFGTGYSNMRRIVSMPFRIIKIDKSLTEVEDNPKLMVVLKNTINMIKGMNMEIVVEGVETEKLVQLFKELECEYIQGYYYSKPIPKDEFIEYCMQKR